MTTPGVRAIWAVRGLAAGAVGLATSWVVAGLIAATANPVVAVATEVIGRVPGSWARAGERTFGTSDKPALVTIVLVVLAFAFAAIGLVGRSRDWRAQIGFFVIAAIGAVAIIDQPSPGRGLVALGVGLVTMLLSWTWLTADGRTDLDRRVVTRLAVVVAGAGVLAVIAPRLGRARRAVEAKRSALKLSGVTPPVVPPGADLGQAQPWQTPNTEFYKIDTTLVSPTVDPSSWTLRIHGMVEREVTLSFADLLARQRTQAWVTLCCVSNPVGGPLIGNAWWSGVRIAPLLAEAGIKPGADAVLQTSVDGWTCGTPLSVLTDDRNAMLAVAMNGQPLPIDHGFPVRTIVPGLYGYVSATKWVVDFEVTTMDKAVGFWIPRGWAVQGPIKLMSRIDRPADHRIAAGPYTFAGVAWEQHVGIAAVELSINGGPWTRATLARTPGADTWVQWSAVLDVPKGDHEVSVRAIDRRGRVQTSQTRDVVPDGATGWHTVEVTAT